MSSLHNSSVSSRSSTDTPQFFNSIQVQVLHRAAKNYKKYGELKREDSIALCWMFGTCIEQAMELIDRDRISVLKSPTNKVIMSVHGTGGQVYWIPPGACICQCHNYCFGDTAICKHVLGAYFMLASSTQITYEPISDKKLKDVLQEIRTLNLNAKRSFN